MATKIALTPPKGGPYRVLATALGAATSLGRSDIYAWAAGNEVESRATVIRGQDDQLQIVLDKSTYRIGNTATALIKSA